MPAVVVVGTQWGDEGKGKVTDYLAREADVVVRYQGGPNAGHTVVVDGEEFRLHLVPSGILYPGKLCVVGNGVVVDPEVLVGEIEYLQSRGRDVSGLRVSARAHLVMPYHRILDALQEQALGERRIGTTLRGVGPAYMDKAARVGLRVGDLLEPATFRTRLEHNLADKNRFLQHVYGAEPLRLEDVLESYLAWGEKLRVFVADTSPLINRAIAAGQKVLFEGAQGTLLDLDHGTYPYVTSSHPVAGGACIGAGVGPTRIDRVIGVVKAYTSRVGDGPFPTELHGEEGDLVRERGHEYGTTTGRPRRVGWLDAVMVRYAALLSGLDGIAITRLDVLAGLPRVKVAVAYRYRGGEIEDFPSSLSLLQECEPVYEELPGWPEPPETPGSLADLHPHARRYVEFVQEATGLPVVLISIGRERGQTISLAPVFEPRPPAR
ncbi:MAG: adenylosuccinate synthase [Bacillota bacterium]|nr:adenylosuccinate synthase [Bacillota bacterium]MDI7249556.1 adenylosuccinate synthase [Bacillota bacterium]